MFGGLAANASKPPTSGFGFGAPTVSAPTAAQTTTVTKPATGLGFATGGGGGMVSGPTAAVPTGFGAGQQQTAPAFGGFAGGPNTFGGIFCKLFSPYIN